MTSSEPHGGGGLATRKAKPSRPPVPFSRRKEVGVAQYLLVMALVAYGFVRGAESMGYNWQWHRVAAFIYSWKDGAFIWGPLAEGFAATLLIAVVAFALALAFGLALALGQLGAFPVARALSRAVVEGVRNTPVLVQLYVFYYVVGPVFGLDRFLSGVLCLAIFESAFVAEVYRAGIRSVPRGQLEAAQALGLTPYQALRRIVLPQALRIMAPPMTSEAISVLKNSAIVSVIALGELTAAGRNIIADTYLSLEIWLTVACGYLAVSLALSAAASALERRYAIVEQ